uniref:Glucose-methanol-choline oxidoreductase N-terminal domain-containing protein n=1 Tax=Bionectria ochroleuca TaxID=29856 RepID=A0A0B7JVM3_BIOOC
MRSFVAWALPLLLPLVTYPAGTEAVPLIGSLLHPLDGVIKSAFAGDGVKVGELGDLGGVPGKNHTFDYIVVGGGTAGNTIGYRLAKAGFSVAIVEAGSFLEISKPILATSPGGVTAGSGASLLDSNPLTDWRFVTQPQTNIDNREIHYARGKILGGSSQLNFWYITDLPRARWLSGLRKWDQMLPHFKNSATFTGPDNIKRGANAITKYDADAFSTAGGPLQVSYANFVPSWATVVEKALSSFGFKSLDGFNSGKLLGYSYTTTTVRPEGEIRSSSADFVKTARSEKLATLKVFTQTLAKKILFDCNKKAHGVQVSTNGLGYTLKAKKEVIISGGAFQSPQILMVSGVGPKDQLEKFNINVVADLPGVGQNLWDHVLFGPTFEINGLVDTLSGAINDPAVLEGALQAYIQQQAGPLTSNQVELLGWEKLPDEYRSKFSSETQKALSYFPSDWPEVEFIPLNAYISDWMFPLLQQPVDGKKYTSLTGALVAPLSRGNITLQSADTSDHPLINPNFLGDKGDQEVAIALYRRLRDVARADVLKAIVGAEAYPGAEYQTDEEILSVLRSGMMTVWHAACTCKMGKPTDKMAVIDSKARVFGVKGLRVVDASAFPVLIPGHPQGTVYALAEKIAYEIINGN